MSIRKIDILNAAYVAAISGSRSAALVRAVSTAAIGVGMSPNHKDPMHWAYGKLARAGMRPEAK